MPHKLHIPQLHSYRVTTANNPPPPNSTRLCTRRKTTHMNNSTPQCRHDNFTHHTPHKTLQTAHKLHQTPQPHTTREPNTIIQKTTHAPLKCATKPNCTRPASPHTKTDPTQGKHTRANRTSRKPAGPPRTSHPPQPLHPTPARPTRLRARGEQRPRPSGLARPAVPGRAPAGSQACPVLRPGSGPPRLLTQPQPPFASVAWRSAGAPVAAPKPEAADSLPRSAESSRARRGRGRIPTTLGDQRCLRRRCENQQSAAR